MANEPQDTECEAPLRRDRALVAVTRQREHDASADLDAGLIPVTVPELLRLLHDVVIPPSQARPGAPAALAGLATPPPAPSPPSPPALERLCRDNTMIATAAVSLARPGGTCQVK